MQDNGISKWTSTEKMGHSEVQPSKTTTPGGQNINYNQPTQENDISKWTSTEKTGQSDAPPSETTPPGGENTNHGQPTQENDISKWTLTDPPGGENVNHNLRHDCESSAVHDRKFDTEVPSGVYCTNQNLPNLSDAEMLHCGKAIEASTSSPGERVLNQNAPHCHGPHVVNSGNPNEVISPPFESEPNQSPLPSHDAFVRCENQESCPPGVDEIHQKLRQSEEGNLCSDMIGTDRMVPPSGNEEHYNFLHRHNSDPLPKLDTGMNNGECSSADSVSCSSLDDQSAKEQTVTLNNEDHGTRQNNPRFIEKDIPVRHTKTITNNLQAGNREIEKIFTTLDNGKLCMC